MSRYYFFQVDIPPEWGFLIKYIQTWKNMQYACACVRACVRYTPATLRQQKIALLILLDT